MFTRINGDIPNRGLDMADINMHGVTYMQQINEAGNPAAGLHIEPGIWARGTPDQQPCRASDRGADGVDPTRDRDQRTGQSSR